jgi:peptide-methionine (S)-S-oxide reductase
MLVQVQYCTEDVHILSDASRKKEKKKEEHMTTTMSEVATFGGGCFWCIEAVFDDVRGISDVVSGYMGGTIRNPTYREICSGLTGHAEVIQITFDPQIVSYKEILEVFFAVHDPTTLNRQGHDVGTQYRSVIFYHNAAQKVVAEQVIAELMAERAYADPIVTEVTYARDFYAAEDYHQEYFANNPNQPYCRAVVAPKVAKFRSKYGTLRKSA